MLQIDFDNLTTDGPDLKDALANFAEWAEDNEDLEFIDPRRVARELPVKIKPEVLLEVFLELVNHGYLEPVYMVEDYNGALLEPAYDDLCQIPDKVRDNWDKMIETADLQIVPVFQSCKTSERKWTMYEQETFETIIDEARGIRKEYLDASPGQKRNSILRDWLENLFKEKKYDEKEAHKLAIALELVSSEGRLLSPIKFLMVSLVGFLIGVSVLVCASKAELIHSQLYQMMYYVALIPLGLASSAFLVGVMHAYARFTGSALSGTITVNSAIVVAALVVIGGFYYAPESSGTFTFVVRVFDEGGRPVTNGSVILYLDQDARSAPIAPNGEANFKEIPPKFRKQKVTLRIDIPGYKLFEEQGTVSLSDSVVELIVHKITDYSD